MTYTNDLSINLYRLMVKKNVTVEMLAKALGVSKRMVSYYLEGTAKPTLKRCFAICNYLCVEYYVLIGNY